MPALLSRRDQAHALRLARSQPESLPELNELTARLKARATEIALADGRVRKRLDGVRHRVLAVDYREEKDADGGLVRLGEVALYDYDRDTLIIASVDARSGEVADVREATGSPPITDEERDEAIRLAAGASGAARTVVRKRAQIVAFPTPSYAFDAEPDRKGHRGCTLYVRAGRGGVAALTVDLSAREVVPEERLPDVLHSRPAR
jgi:hypothetical protein